MPTKTGTDIAHVAVTDHRILKTPGTESSSSPVPVATRSPLVLLNGDSLGPREIEGLNRELGSALTFEAEWLKDAAMRKRLAYLALALLDRAGAERPDDLFLERMRARATAIQGKLAEAIKLDERVLQSAPDYEQVIDERVQYAIELGELRPAMEYARRAVAMNPWSAGLHERLAHLEMREKHWEAAIRESHEALRLDPFRRFARMFLIQCLLHTDNDAARAREEFELLTGLFPGEKASLQAWFANEQKTRRD